MIPLPVRSRALPFLLVVGIGLLCYGPAAAFLTHAAAQTADPAPAQPVNQPNAPAADPGMPHTDEKGRHLAPHGTLYVLSYVSVTTDTGVDGFVPGQEVHVISADRPKHTLLVTDGKAQVEVSPAKLTNDMDIAALARQQDQANQVQIATYTQAEEAAFAKREREEAEAEARNDERQKQEAQQQAVNAQVAAQNAQGAQPVNASLGGSGYYDSGGYGYGNPYSYFFVTGASGPGGGRGTLPSHESANTADVQRGTTGAAAGGAHAGGAGGGHPGGGGGGKP